MRKLAIAAVVGLLSGGTAYGQPGSRVYAGAALSAQHTNAEDVNPVGITTAGTVLGVRLTRAFSIEIEANRGIGELSRAYSGAFVSFAGPGASREEIERLAVTMRSETRWTPGWGWSALMMWRSTGASRARVAVFAGVASTQYDVRRTFTVLNIPAGVDRTEADLHRIVPDEHVSRSRGGLTAGVLVPIRLIRKLSVAPEIRYTYGSFGDEIYTTLRGGARVMWGF